jgi:uroporphyrin-III C-methyltransferase/precorrin-2 dehydrogenase/sirohydrochlorin ferrochelatase
MTEDFSDAPRFLPLAIDLRNRNCLVVGGGGVGTRKALTLRRAGAAVTVVAPTVTAELGREIQSGGIRWIENTFREEHLEDIFLVVAATDDQHVNAAVVRLAASRQVLVCDASSSERSQVIFGALLQHHDLTVAVFSDGRDPTAARQTRDRIADALLR